MKRRGFTLIELLAVIIILAIIALIATPIVMRIIENSKKGAAERSAENYARAVETELMALKANGTIIEDGNYSIKSNGNLCLDKSATCDEASEIKIDIKGSTPESGKIAISNEKVAAYKISDNGNITKNGYVQEYKPKYFIYSDSGYVIGSVPPELSDVPPTGTGHNIYAGYDVSDDKISAVYTCIKKDGNEYCIKGFDDDAFETNKEILDELFPGECTLSDGNYSCYSAARGISAYTNSNKMVGIFEGYARCITVGWGGFGCMS